jgi:hypothetical protein
MENGKAVCLPLAPKSVGSKAQVKIVLACLIKNNEATNLELSGVTFSFPGSSAAAKIMQGVTMASDPIAPHASTWWSNGVVKLSENNAINNAVYLDAPAPPKIEVKLSFTGYNLPIRITADLAAHKCPAPTGGWLFPFSASDLRAGEYYSTSAQHWANGGGMGRQIYAHDIGCVGWDNATESFKSTLPGKDGSQNENYRLPRSHPESGDGQPYLDQTRR